MCGAIPPLPQYVFMAWCLVKHRDNFNFTFIICVVLLNFSIYKKLCPKREKAMVGWRRLHNEELHNLYASPNIVKVINQGG
jgi:hypothetical protein